MNKKMCMTLAAVALMATMAVAGTMTPAEMTTKVVNCPNCKSMANYPEMANSLRPDIFKTEAGFVSTFLVTDAKMLPMCQKWEGECAANMAKPELASSFCPICVSYGSMMTNKDIKMESFMGSMGRVTVASSTTKAGTEQLHAHVAMMNEAMAIMPAAMAEIMKSAKTKTADAGE